MPKTRHDPSSSCVYTGPPESPWHESLPDPPSFTSLSAVTCVIVVLTSRLIPYGPLSASPKPTTVTSCPGVIADVSQPLRMRTIGTSLTGCASLPNAKSPPPPGPPPGYVRQNCVFT